MKDLNTSLARGAVRGTTQQGVMDLATICARVSESCEGWPQLATQLDSLSAELAQAAGWLRGVSVSVGEHDA